MAADKDVDELRTLPTWRSDDELCLNYGPAADKSGKRSEIVLCKVNWQTKQVDRRVLSEDWSAPIARGFLVKDEQPPQTEDKDAQP